jgi:ATP-dependent protease Clp ATPase subunit
VKGATSIIKTVRRNRCVPPKEDASTRPKFVEVNTQNILFIAGGAFDGIERIISKD